jgi:putative phosphoribosyl transferase
MARNRFRFPREPEGRFRDRLHAGQVLAAALEKYAGQSDAIVLALPRGGVPVGYEVATRLGAPLDVFVVRKLGLPGQDEFAMGALASGGVIVLNDELIAGLGVPMSVVEAVISRERAELERREHAYRGDRPSLDVVDRIAILVDDGLATGSTMRAAVLGLRQRAPRRVVVGVPIAALSTCSELASEVDEIVCARTPEPFHAVGLWYVDFEQTSDEKVRELLDAAARAHAARGGASRAQYPPTPGSKPSQST